jgi:ABC-type bacteriocin/lantibiotic exporters, contain an N-terminal double-glycine peptidase domain
MLKFFAKWKNNNWKKYHTLQKDQADCGPACIAMVLKYYSHQYSFENLRKLSGTNAYGSNLLGLYQTFTKLGFGVEGVEASTTDLEQITSPCILHTTNSDKTNHFIVFFTFDKGKYICGDPAHGIIKYSKEDLESIWKSKTCLYITTPPKNKCEEEQNKHNKWIITSLKRDSAILTLSVFLGIAYSVLGLVMALFSETLIDKIIPEKDFSYLLNIIILVGILLLFRTLISALRRTFLLDHSRNFNISIIEKFYSTILELPVSFFQSRKTGDFITRFNDTRRIQQLIAQLVGNFIIEILIIIVTTTFLFFIHPQTGYIAIGFTPIYLILIVRFNTPLLKAQRKVMGTYASSESIFINSIQSIQSIKNLNAHNHFKNSIKSIYGEFQEQSVNLGKLNIKISIVLGILNSIFILSIITVSSKDVLLDNLKTGQLMAILTISSTLLPAITKIGSIYIPYSSAKVAFERMVDYSLQPNKSETQNPPSKIDRVNLEKVSFRFPGQKTLLKSVSFQIPTGRITGLIGENGSGKSTLIQLILKFYDLENGSININNSLDLAIVNEHEWQKRVGIVPQQIEIFDASLIENINPESVKNKRTKEVIEFCKEYGFDQYFEELPLSYLTQIGESGIQLSGGQKQLLALARALYKKPDILLLDEANSAMDRNTLLFTHQLLQNIKSQVAILFISHNIESINKLCDYIYILEKGIISSSGNQDYLLKTDNLYSQHYKYLTNV